MRSIVANLDPDATRRVHPVDEAVSCRHCRWCFVGHDIIRPGFGLCVLGLVTEGSNDGKPWELYCHPVMAGSSTCDQWETRDPYEEEDE